MEAQFTIRDTLPNFANWVNNYGASVQPSFIMRNIGLNPDGDGWLLEHPTPDGEVLFYVLGVERKLLNVRAVTRWRLDMDTGQWLTEDAELNTYFAELVRAIRLEWEPIALTKTELYEQSFRRLEAGEKPKDVYNNFFRPNLSDADKPKDASQEADDHNAWKSAMTARRNKRKRKKG